MLICRKQNVSQERLCLDELPMKHRQVSTTNPPDFLPARLAALQAPGRLWTEPVILPDFFFFFFPKLEGKGLGRNTHWLCLAFSDCSELGILIIRTSHSPVPWFLMWETFSSLPENLLRLNCPGSKIFFIPHWASFLSIFGTPSDASIVSSSLFSKTPNCIAVSLY